MVLSLVAVGAKVTAAIANGIIGQVNGQGLTQVVPTGVAGTGVSVGPRGKVTFANTATNIDLQGIFSATYDDYLLIFHSRSSVTSITAQLLDNTNTPNASANYDAQVLIGTSTTAVVAQGLAGTGWGISATTASIQDMEIRVFSPNLAEETRALVHSTSTSNPMTTSAAVAERGLLHRLTVQYTGLRVVLSVAGPVGSVRVYGYNPN